MSESPIPQSPKESAILARYWRGNLRLMAILLLIWALAGPVCGILIADYLNQFTLPGTGYPLGFWFAQQGSIVVFVLLILVYALLMNRHDRKHHDEREALHIESPDASSR
jgi:putative solute:sodium symporter small subunit